jgi:HAD superfamily hydrolase (TIGR01509 family)
MKETMTIKAVIFDLDGTITQPYLDFDMVRDQMGLSENDGPIWEAMQKMTARQRSLAEDVLDYHEDLAVKRSQLNIGAKKTLNELKQAGIGVGILTRNLRQNALAVGQKHGLKFDIVIGREQGPVKPDAFGVLEICRYFSVEPSNTMLVGDYLYDLLCAKAAGAVAVLLANHNKADQFCQHADFTIESLEEILDIIEQRKDVPDEKQ